MYSDKSFSYRPKKRSLALVFAYQNTLFRGTIEVVPCRISPKFPSCLFYHDLTLFQVLKVS